MEIDVQVGVGGAEDIELALQLLREGGVVAFPTETVYGLGADAENPEAVERVFFAKGRPADHPLIVHIASLDALPSWVDSVPEAARRLAEHFWPGPLTLILRRSPRVPLVVTGGLETVGIRVPSHPIAQSLLQAFGGALAAPSANLFGSVSPTTAAHVQAGLGSAVDFILDGGPCGVGVESTIVDATGHALSILRPGGVSREKIERVLGYPVVVRTQPGSVRVPGTLPSHYAPRAEVVLVEPARLLKAAARALADGKRVGALLPYALRESSLPQAIVLLVPEGLTAYARALYTLLREFDSKGCELVFASLPDEQGLGAAIADRLRRAAGPRDGVETGGQAE